MGIRFHCHHCNKRLNVKSTQAGEEGQCPNCGSKILVPTRSTNPGEMERQLLSGHDNRRSKDSGDSSIGLRDVDEQVTIDGLPAEQRHRNSLESNPTVFAPPLFDSNVGDSTQRLFMLDKPQLPDSVGKIDPIAESSTHIWYFRSRELGEKGPLKGKAMQEFLDQGDICVGSIVWRDDWNDWIPAEKVFPRLAAEVENKQQTVRASRAFKQANDALPKRPSPQTSLSKRKRRMNQIFFGAIVLGFVIIVVLLVVLLKLVADNP